MRRLDLGHWLAVLVWLAVLLVLHYGITVG